ncbi:MAG: membrane protein insertion efficiency factor YidD [Desulfonatronovibrio sp.]
MRYILQKIITFYQLVLSPLTPCVCRFHPTCSEYSREAIQTYGVFKGLLLTIMRIARCNPFFRSGADPVPRDFSLKNIIKKFTRPDGFKPFQPDKSRVRSQNR